MKQIVKPGQVYRMSAPPGARVVSISYLILAIDGDGAVLAEWQIDGRSHSRRDCSPRDYSRMEPAGTRELTEEQALDAQAWLDYRSLS
jgi:hypothetical protein